MILTYHYSARYLSCYLHTKYSLYSILTFILLVLLSQQLRSTNSILLLTTHSHSMSNSVHINVTQELILDPALRCAPYYGADKECSRAQQRRAYLGSAVMLPKVWSRKTLRPLDYLSTNSSNAMLYYLRLHDKYA